MKKAILMTGILSMMVLVSCKKEVKTTEVTPVDVDTVEVAAPPVEEVESTDGTSVEMNSDGVKVDTKTGDNATKVEVKDGKAAVEVKK
jgi:hypothetical protein